MSVSNLQRTALAAALALASVSAAVAAPRTLDALAWAPPERFGFQPNGSSFVTNSAMSADGSRLVLTSNASNLYALDRTFSDIYLFDDATDTLEVLRTADGAVIFGATPVLSGDGTTVAFAASGNQLRPDLDATTTARVWLFDLATRTAERVDVDGAATTCAPQLSHDASVVLFYAGSSCGGVPYTVTRGGTPVAVPHPESAPDTPGVVSRPVLARDGRHVAFEFQLGFAPARPHVWVHNRETLQNTLVDVTPEGSPSGSFSGQPAISADGRRVAFTSSATDLVTGDTNGKPDVFLRDLDAATTVRLSATESAQGDGTSQRPSISGDGATVVFQTVATNLGVTGGTAVWRAGTLASSALGRSADDESLFLVSHDGAAIASGTTAALVAGDTNNARDVYVVRGANVARASFATSGPHPAPTLGTEPHVSPDGRSVWFTGSSTIPSGGTPSSLLVHDRGTAATTFFTGGLKDFVHDVVFDPPRVVTFVNFPAGGVIDFSPPPPGQPAPPPILFVAQPGLAVPEHVIAETSDGMTPTGAAKIGTLSRDGAILAYVSNAVNLQSAVPVPANTDQIYVRALGGTASVLATQVLGVAGNGASYHPSISATGRYVAFVSDATNLVSDDANGKGDVFLLDRSDGTIERVSVSTTGGDPDGGSTNARVTADGRYVVFQSGASNLVDGDTNAATDVFVRDRVAGTTRRVSVDSNGNQAFSASTNPRITPDGRLVTFESAWPLVFRVEPFPSFFKQIWLVDVARGEPHLVSEDRDGRPGAGNSTNARLSDDGRTIVFQSGADNWTLDRGYDGISTNVFVKTLDVDALHGDDFE